MKRLLAISAFSMLGQEGVFHVLCPLTYAETRTEPWQAPKSRQILEHDKHSQTSRKRSLQINCRIIDLKINDFFTSSSPKKLELSCIQNT
jgi:hypothetical protein